MMKRYALALALSSPLGATAAPDALLMIAPLNQTMPLASFDAGKLDGGIIKDLGDAIARRAGRRASYLSVANENLAAKEAFVRGPSSTSPRSASEARATASSRVGPQQISLPKSES